MPNPTHDEDFRNDEREELLRELADTYDTIADSIYASRYLCRYVNGRWVLPDDIYFKIDKIKAIKEEWTSWGNKRLIEVNTTFDKSYNEQIAAFVDAQIKTELSKIR